MLEALDRGRHLPASPKLKEKLSKIRTNCVVSEETKAKCKINGALANKNKKKVTKGTVSKYVDKSEISEYILSG